MTYLKSSFNSSNAFVFAPSSSSNCLIFLSCFCFSCLVSYISRSFLSVFLSNSANYLWSLPVSSLFSFSISWYLSISLYSQSENISLSRFNSSISSLYLFISHSFDLSSSYSSAIQARSSFLGSQSASTYTSLEWPPAALFSMARLEFLPGISYSVGSWSTTVFIVVDVVVTFFGVFKYFSISSLYSFLILSSMSSLSLSLFSNSVIRAL